MARPPSTVSKLPAGRGHHRQHGHRDGDLGDEGIGLMGGMFGMLGMFVGLQGGVMGHVRLRFFSLISLITPSQRAEWAPRMP